MQANMRTLSFVTTAAIAAGTTVSMGIFAVYQYLTTPGLTVGELVMHHSWHVLALGAVTYTICRIILQHMLVRPLERVHEHLYGIGMGRMERLELETDVREIRSIVNHVNLMLDRMAQGFDTRAIATCQEELDALRRLAGGRGLPDAEVLQHLRDLEEAVFSIIRDRRAQPGPREPAAAA